MSPFLENIVLLLGTIIGAGIFSLPIALRQSGWIFFLITIIGLAYLLAKTNMFYRDIIESVPQKHQLPGYVRIILGRPMSRIASILLLFSTLGALLAYLIIGGSFTGNVLGISSWAGSIVFYIGVLLITIFAGKKIEAFDVFFTIIKIVLLALIMITSLGHLTLFTMRFIPPVGVNPLGSYGAILFALMGISIIPELKKDRHVHKAIYIAEFIVLICYILFAFILFPYLSVGSVRLKNILFDITGVFTILSPYLMLTWIGHDLLVKDLKVNRQKALLTILGVPIVFFFIGLTSFIQVISLTGGVFLGSIALLVTMMYKEKFPARHKGLIALIQWVFVLGVILEIWHFFYH